MSDQNNPYRPFPRSSRYDWRIHPVTGEKKFHAGEDFAAPEGTPIPAATPGTVVYSGFNKNFGNTVIVHTTNGYSLYAHMKEGAPRPQMGQRIWPGDVIGQVGRTGAFARGSHLHYSVVKDGARIDPAGTGNIGVNVDQEHTFDPATFDNSIPYAEQAPRAEQMLAPGTSSGAPIANPASATSKSAPHTSGSPLPGPGNLFNDRFGNWRSLTPDGSVNSPALEVLPGGLPGLIADHLRRQQQSGVAGSPAPAAQSDKVNSPDDDPATFDERFRAAAPIRRLSSPIDTLMWR